MDFRRHLRLACKRAVNAGRMTKNGFLFKLADNANGAKAKKVCQF